MGLTQFLALYPHFTPKTLDVTLSDMPTGRSIPWIGRPPDGAPPIGRRYPIGVYPNPTCPIYPTMSSFLQDRDLF